ncbi:MAG: mechanosensitive ion channel [Clostridia bacterium]|nr:mechanosensitive ion channel [Clostridia bacterium]
MSWSDFWEDIKGFFTNTDNYWTIIAFFAVLLIGIIVVKLLVKLCKGMFKRAKTEPIAQKFVLTIIKFLLYLVLVLILLSVIGIDISGVITALSACVLAVGLALEDLIASVAYGMVVVCYKMVKEGDFVEVDGVSGSVSGINFIFTSITTTDNKRITVPNSKLVTGSLTNYGANPTRRVDFTFSVAYESDVEQVKKIVTDVMKSDGRVRLEKEPFCKLKTLNSSSLDFFANCWCDGSDYWDVYYYVVENVYNEFKRNGISVPFQQIEVRNRVDEVVMPVIGDGIPERVEKQRKEEDKKKMFDIENDDFSEYIDGKKAEYLSKKEKRRIEKEQQKAEKEGNTETKKELHAGATNEDADEVGSD